MSADFHLRRSARIAPAGAGPGWTTASALGNFRQLENVSLTLSASGAASYAVTGGSLPAGLSLSGGGALTGRPSAVGPISFTVTATGGGTSTRSFNGNIVEQPAAPS